MTQLNGAIKHDLKKLDSWIQNNKPSLNVAKTHSMLPVIKQKRRVIENQHKSLGLNIGGNASSCPKC